MFSPVIVEVSFIICGEWGFVAWICKMGADSGDNRRGGDGLWCGGLHPAGAGFVPMYGDKMF